MAADGVSSALSGGVAKLLGEALVEGEPAPPLRCEVPPMLPPADPPSDVDDGGGQEMEPKKGSVKFLCSQHTSSLTQCNEHCFFGNLPQSPTNFPSKLRLCEEKPMPTNVKVQQKL